MRRVVLIVILISTAPAALAQSRPTTLGMTCFQAQRLVASQGAAVLATGPTTYDRYVSGGNSCVLGERAEPTWVPTADMLQCPIGFRCASRQRQSQR
jgi:hypothetical protein